MTQPERSEVSWTLLFAVDCALRQLQAALPEGVRIIISVDVEGQDRPLELEYGPDTSPEDVEGFLRYEVVPLERKASSTRTMLRFEPPLAS